MNRTKVLLACFACLLMVLTVSGCVDIYGARGVFGGKAPAQPLRYKVREKAELGHAFDTNLTDPTTWSYTASASALVKRHTQFLKVYIDLTIFTTPIPIPNVTLPERYLRVMVKAWDGTVWVDARYVTTTREAFTASSPIDGLWSVSVQSVGIGFPRIVQDQFKVMLTVKEPV